MERGHRIHLGSSEHLDLSRVPEEGWRVVAGRDSTPLPETWPFFLICIF